MTRIAFTNQHSGAGKTTMSIKFMVFSALF